MKPFLIGISLLTLLTGGGAAAQEYVTLQKYQAPSPGDPIDISLTDGYFSAVNKNTGTLCATTLDAKTGLFRLDTTPCEVDGGLIQYQFAQGSFSDFTFTKSDGQVFQIIATFDAAKNSYSFCEGTGGFNAPILPLTHQSHSMSVGTA